MELKEGNILTATEDYIAQQTCCTACRAHGLSEAIATMFLHGNPYSLRKPIAPRKNTARPEDRPEAGTCLILGDGKEKRYIACLFGQYAMGKSGKYDACGIPDTQEDRLQYFELALEDFARQIPPTASVAFPYKIGCGLAGGDWKKYSSILEKWAKTHPYMKIALYKL